MDYEPAVVGTTVAGLVVRPVAELADEVAAAGATIAVIATPASVAQQVADALAAAGVHGILTFAPQTLQAPDGVHVRAVDLASELQLLAFHGRHREHGKA